VATPGDLVRIFAEEFRVPSVTVSGYYRALREAALVTKGGRGRSAPTSTAKDAAALMVALLGAQSGVGADEAVEALSRVPALFAYKVSGETASKQYPFDMSAFLGHMFVDSAIYLLSHYSDIYQILEVHEPGNANRLGVSVSPSHMTATIRMGGTAVFYAARELDFINHEGMYVRHEIGESHIAKIVRALAR
jgi:hypothetical protein